MMIIGWLFWIMVCYKKHNMKTQAFYTRADRIKYAVFLCFLMIVICSSHSAFAQNSRAHSYFDMAETFSADESDFTKWTTMMSRYEDQGRIAFDQCDHVPFHPCAALSEWQDTVKNLRERPLTEQLRLVNNFANA